VNDARTRSGSEKSATATDALNRGRVALGRRAWRDAFEHLSAADRETPLGAEDLERFATAASLIGRDDVSIDIWARAHQAFLNRGDTERAARHAFWLAFQLLIARKLAPGSGWIARGRRLLEEGNPTDVGHGLLLIPLGLQRVIEGEFEAACAAFTEAAEIGDREHNADLSTLARHGRGRTLIRLGKIAEGLTLLDESMVAITADDVSPIIVGGVYCSVIAACHEIFDLRRAHEWTTALNDWCASQPDAVHHRGFCLVHRSEMMQLHGEWPNAMHEAQRACEQLAEPPRHPAAGEALYRQAELFRLRGDFVQAEEGYREASQFGREPYPGLAQLRLAQGQIEAAATAIRRVLDESPCPARPRLLPAYVEIMLVAGDLPAARSAAVELTTIASQLDAPFLHAVSANAMGAVLLAEHDARGALAALRRACTLWHELDAPYEVARARMCVSIACRVLGDDDGADMELDAARRILTQLEARPDLARLEDLHRDGTPKAAGGLSAREAQVLRLVATGKTNRAIAEELRISDKTVARHVSNIFVKLGLSTRAAATAYAYQHDLR
jgi:DNA-binding CsgD family transcriptional regulator